MGQFGVYARNDGHRSIGRVQKPRWCMALVIKTNNSGKIYSSDVELWKVCKCCYELKL